MTSEFDRSFGIIEPEQMEIVKSEYGNRYVSITAEDILALITGKVLFVEIDSTLEHDGSWIDGRWYEWEDIHGNREIARMKLDAIDHFYPETKTIKEEDVCRYRELEEGVKVIEHKRVVVDEE